MPLHRLYTIAQCHNHLQWVFSCNIIRWQVTLEHNHLFAYSSRKVVQLCVSRYSVSEEHVLVGQVLANIDSPDTYTQPMYHPIPPYQHTILSSSDYTHHCPIVLYRENELTRSQHDLIILLIHFLTLPTLKHLQSIIKFQVFNRSRLWASKISHTS